MKFLLLSLLVLSSATFAADKKPKGATANGNKMSAQDKMDSKTLDINPGDKSKDVGEDTALYTDSDKMKMKVTCKSHTDGHELKQGEAGYEDCLQKVKNDKKNPHKPNADINVKVGE